MTQQGKKYEFYFPVWNTKYAAGKFAELSKSSKISYPFVIVG